MIKIRPHRNTCQFIVLLLAILARLAGGSSEEATSFDSTEPAHASKLPLSTHSCLNWTAAPEAAGGNCTRLTGNGLLRCYGGMNNLAALAKAKSDKLPAQQILLCGWPHNMFNPMNELQKFPALRTLTIEYSSFTEFRFDFPEMYHLQTINISWTNLSHVSARTFKRIHHLKVLDLRWNQLMQLESPLILSDTFQELYLAGNPWNCTRNFKWLFERGELVADRDELLCMDRKYKERQMMLVVHYKVLLKRECESHPHLQNCSCLMHHILPKHIPLYTVNCSGQGLYSLPDYLPENTTMLFVNDNKISDINPLRQNPHYRHVVDVHLDNNRIRSLDELENTYWLEHFRLLSVRGNLLRKLQVYALDNALDDNDNANLLQLSRNPWHCTCKFGMRLRELLTKYREIVRDAANVSCTYVKGDELRRAKVLSLTRQDMCNVSTEETKIHIIDWINGVLASLIVFILGKLAYDYYHYKYYGRVPWIVMKLP
ncbi:protein singed wings 2 [Scaptodrosophila lebanonensis]|uniref:Protein singed wings 2 n=1 Tax=Drosophila lebanonensis TaxID=7225 RepID=A0A6J2UEZ2_DROLE|nr:protein singed wings 2 [Scaptodrosophila lebanonensis]